MDITNWPIPQSRAGFRRHCSHRLGRDRLRWPNETMLYDQPRTDRKKPASPVRSPLRRCRLPSLHDRRDHGCSSTPDGTADDQAPLRRNPAAKRLARRIAKTGIRGKAGQRISFAPGTDAGHPLAAGRGRDAPGRYRRRYVVNPPPPTRGPWWFHSGRTTPRWSSGMFAAIEEAQSLVPKPKMIVCGVSVRPRGGQGHRRDPLARASRCSRHR